MIVKEEGFKGFVKGVGPKIISSTPSSAISWSIYEMIKR
jgi:solute carrier family 25 iron transporter 28/37